MQSLDIAPDGWSLFHAASATSSSDLAFGYLEENPGSHKVAFSVDEQTRGRGRQGRIWRSQSGDGMYLSAVIAPGGNLADWPSLSFMTALSLLQAIQITFPELDSRLRVKWPNDVLIDGHKIAGILLEARPPSLVIGCGVNLKNAPQIKGRVLPIADISMFSKKQVTANQLACTILVCLSENIMIWQSKDGPSSCIRVWREFCDMIGQNIEVTLADRVLSGICISIDNEGVLSLEDVSGRVHRITTGDVQIMKTSS